MVIFGELLLLTIAKTKRSLGLKTQRITKKDLPSSWYGLRTLGITRIWLMVSALPSFGLKRIIRPNQGSVANGSLLDKTRLEIRNRKKKQMVTPISLNEKKNQVSKCDEKISSAVTMPKLKESDLVYNVSQDEIGGGCFGKVFKANYLGRDVAYKACKLPKRQVGRWRKSQAFKLKKEQKLHITIQCLQGLVYLHAMGIVHADLQTANVLLSQDGSIVKFCDMGLSRINESLGATRAKSMVPGTTMYMHPEGLLGHVLPNIQCDVWCMSATACVIFDGGDFWEIGDDDAEGTISAKLRKETEPDGLRCLKNSDSIIFLILRQALNYKPDKLLQNYCQTFVIFCQRNRHRLMLSQTELCRWTLIFK